MKVAALLFDFNGTLSRDEELLCEIYQGLFAELGRPMTRADYFDGLAGLSEEAIIGGWLGPGIADLESVINERIERYVRLADGTTIDDETRRAVREAAEAVPVGIVSSASRREIEPVIARAGLDGVFRFVVAAEDVTEHKPSPQPYLRAVDLLQLPAADVVAFEDSVAGVTAATTAGLRCVALAGTAPTERLREAETIAARIDRDLLRSLLSGDS